MTADNHDQFQYDKHIKRFLFANFLSYAPAWFTTKALTKELTDGNVAKGFVFQVFAMSTIAFFYTMVMVSVMNLVGSAINNCFRKKQATGEYASLVDQGPKDSNAPIALMVADPAQSKTPATEVGIRIAPPAYPQLHEDVSLLPQATVTPGFGSFTKPTLVHPTPGAPSINHEPARLR
jgi:hypothetical protein